MKSTRARTTPFEALVAVARALQWAARVVLRCATELGRQLRPSWQLRWLGAARRAWEVRSTAALRDVVARTPHRSGLFLGPGGAPVEALPVRAYLEEVDKLMQRILISELAEDLRAAGVMWILSELSGLGFAARSRFLAQAPTHPAARCLRR